MSNVTIRESGSKSGVGDCGLTISASGRVAHCSQRSLALYGSPSKYVCVTNSAVQTAAIDVRIFEHKRWAVASALEKQRLTRTATCDRLAGFGVPRERDGVRNPGWSRRRLPRPHRRL